MVWWQSIDNAPKDGTPILGYENGVTCAMRFAEGWEGRRWYLVGVCWGDESSDCSPSHWQPLPEPPK